MKHIFLIGALLCTLPFYAQKSMADIPYPVGTKQVVLPSGLRLAYLDSGAGEYTLVFVHGLGSNLKSWQKTMAVLDSTYRCVAFDLPGYGQSSKGDHPFDMTFFATALREFTTALDLKNVVLVGHSMGGQIALSAVLQDSAFARRLVLLAPAGIETFSEPEKTWFSMVYTPALLKATPPEQIRKNFEANFFQFPADAEFMVQDRFVLRETGDYDAYCAMIPKCVAGMLREPVYERLPKVSAPTLLVFGENDALIPNRFLHKTLTTQMVAADGQRRLPNCRLKMVPNCGHFVQWESAATVNAALLEFLKE